jgi:hypothetical protein
MPAAQVQPDSLNFASNVDLTQFAKIERSYLEASIRLIQPTTIGCTCLIGPLVPLHGFETIFPGPSIQKLLVPPGPSPKLLIFKNESEINFCNQIFNSIKMLQLNGR